VSYCLFMLLCMLGTAPSPVGDAQQLNIIKFFPEREFYLTADIDASGWETAEIFRGKLDGRGHTIRNLPASLFGTLENAEVGNLRIESGRGSLAVKSYDSVIKNVAVKDVYVLGGASAGGIVGEIRGGVVDSCRFDGKVSGSGYAGGISGLITDEALLTDCHAFGEVSGGRAAGALVGAAYGAELSENAKHGIKIISCHSRGSVDSVGMAGGFAGILSYVAVDACGSKGDVETAGAEAGGFVGRLTHKSRITNSSAGGNVKAGGRQAGGFVGLLTEGSGIEFSCSAGDVHGRGEVGGFAGTISAIGAPNTLFACLSYAKWVTADEADDIHRLVGKSEHLGVNSSYAYLGTAVAAEGRLRHISPNPYGADGGDFNKHTLDGILTRLGWDRRYLFSLHNFSE